MKPLKQEDYFEDSRISQSKLKDFIKCPNLFKARHIDKTFPFDMTNNIMMGKVADFILTEPEKDLEEMFTKVSRRPANKWQDDDGKWYINKSILDGAQKMADRVNSQKIYHKMFGWMDNQKVFCNENQKALLDYFGIDKKGVGWIADLKSTEDINKYEYKVSEYGYHLQMAFYRMMAKEAHPEVKKWLCYHIVVDSTKQNKFMLYRFDQKRFAHEERKIKEALKLMKFNIRMSEGLCFHCPPELDCEYSQLEAGHIQII